MPKRKQWYFYTADKRVRSMGVRVRAISGKLLPRRTKDYLCALLVYHRINGIRVSSVSDLVFGDPRLLRRCTLMEKGISRMPKCMANRIENRREWWTLRWKGKLVFVHSLHLALAKDAKEQVA